MVVIENQRGYQQTMFTVGPVHTRDHGPVCSIAGVRNISRDDQEGLIECPLSRWNREEGSQHSPRSPGGPQVRPKVLVAQHTCKHEHVLIAVSFPRPDVSCLILWFIR